MPKESQKTQKSERGEGEGDGDFLERVSFATELDFGLWIHGDF
jgi:hypothetical protein